MSDQQPFAHWLKQQRKALDLTREALAERALCSASTLRRLEAADLRPSRQLAETLAAALGIPREQLPAFIEFARGLTPTFSPAAIPPGSHISHRSPSRLPAPLTSFVGRKQELAAICDLLRQPGVRLLTLSGPPGAGKTRLSLAAAQKLVETSGLFPDGAYFVPLAPISDPALVAAAIARALDVRQASQPDGALSALKEFLHPLKLLLVLDNFEQVIGAAPLLTDLLMSAPGVKTLVTSREVLQVYGEHEFPVPPLPLPDVQRLPTAQALTFYSHFSSIQLFKERARAVQLTFQLTPENAADVARICAWLDGLPLAIEMAAAQVRWLSIPQVFEQLQRRLAALTGGPRDLSPRQQSLQGAIEWSYDLLSEPEKRLFNGLGVFAGGFDLSAAQQLAESIGLETAIPLENRLQTLVQKSLLRYFPAEHPRYELFEMLREFALARLSVTGELEAVRQAHAEIYARLAAEAGPVLASGGDQPAWLARLEAEIHNLTAALHWAIESPARAGFALQLVDSLFSFWLIRGYLGDGRCWMNAALSLDDSPTAQRAKILNYAGNLARIQGDLAQAKTYQEQALAIQQRLEDEPGIARSFESLGILAGMQGDYARAAEIFEQALPIRRRLDDLSALLPPLNNLAIARQRLGDWPAAEALYREASQICAATGNQKALGHALYGLAQVQMAQGNFAAALDRYRESLQVRYQLGDRPAISMCLGGIGLAFYSLGDAARAATLIAAGSALQAELGIVAGAANRDENEQTIAEIQANLGEAAFAQAWAAGQEMPLSDAVAFALE